MLALNPSDYTEFFVVVRSKPSPWLGVLSQTMAVFINIKLEFYSNNVLFFFFVTTDVLHELWTMTGKKVTKAHAFSTRN